MHSYSLTRGLINYKIISDTEAKKEKDKIFKLCNEYLDELLSEFG